jgi:hypothetical protein
MQISVQDAAKVAALLAQDVVSTLGPRHVPIVTAAANNHRQFVGDYDLYVDSVVAGVQQDVHCGFIDTTWPLCPRHPNHPLWLHDGSWCCEQDGVAVARLGELR